MNEHQQRNDEDHNEIREESLHEEVHNNQGTSNNAAAANDEEDEVVFYHDQHRSLNARDIALAVAFMKRAALLRAITDLERNVRVSRDLTIDDDELAGLLGKALAKNTSHKYSLKLTLGARLSAQGAQSILDGLKGSKVTSLILDNCCYDWRSDATRSSCVHLFVEGALQIMPELSLELMLNDELADTIGTTLLRGNSNYVRMLSIRIGSCLTENGAQRLANSFASSSLQALRVFLEYQVVDRKATHIILSQAVNHVRKLELYFQFNDDDAIVLSEALKGNTTLKRLSIRVESNIMSSSSIIQLANQIRLSHIVHVELQHLLYAMFLPKVGHAGATSSPRKLFQSFKHSLSV